MVAPKSLVDFLSSLSSTSPSLVVVFLVLLGCHLVPFLPEMPYGSCEINFEYLLHQMYPVHFESSCPHSIWTGIGVNVNGLYSSPRFPLSNLNCEHGTAFLINLPSTLNNIPVWNVSSNPLAATRSLNFAT